MAKKQNYNPLSGNWDYTETTAGGGEANTASNVGTGTGLFKQKAGVDLEFKSVLAGSNSTAVAGDTNEVTVTVDELLMFVGIFI